MHHLPGGLYTLRRARPNYPLAGLTYEERARARAAGKAADVEALMELKRQVVVDAEGLLSSWQDGRDPCTFERVGEGLAALALHGVSACMPGQNTAMLELKGSWRRNASPSLPNGSDGNHPEAVHHTAALCSISFSRVPCFMQCSSRRGSCLGGKPTHPQSQQPCRFVASCRCSVMPTQAVCLRSRSPPLTTSWTTTPSCAMS